MRRGIEHGPRSLCLHDLGKKLVTNRNREGRMMNATGRQRGKKVTLNVSVARYFAH